MLERGIARGAGAKGSAQPTPKPLTQARVTNYFSAGAAADMHPSGSFPGAAAAAGRSGVSSSRSSAQLQASSGPHASRSSHMQFALPQLSQQSWSAQPSRLPPGGAAHASAGSAAGSSWQPQAQPQARQPAASAAAHSKPFATAASSPSSSSMREGSAYPQPQARQDQKTDALQLDQFKRTDNSRSGCSSPLRPSAPNSSARASDLDGNYCSFLSPANRRDAAQRRPDHPQFDARSLFIPPDVAGKFTPVEKQYWDFKKTRMDLIVAFKMGKFYELYDHDALIGIEKLRMTGMAGKRARCGFPEQSLETYAQRFLELGYKVSVVDQVERPPSQSSGSAHLADRAQTRVFTSSTVTSEAMMSGDKQQARYLLAITERPINQAESTDTTSAPSAAASASVSSSDGKGAQPMSMHRSTSEVEYGFCFTDVTTGELVIGQERDDAQRAFLTQLLGAVPAHELLVPQGVLSSATQARLRVGLPAHVCKSELKPGDEFWDAATTKRQLEKHKYFEKPKRSEKDSGKGSGGSNSSTSSSSSSGSGSRDWPSEPHWPDPLRAAIDQRLHLAVSALGAVVWYLRGTMLDRELLTLSQYTMRSWLDHADANNCVAIDGHTQANLEIVRAQDGSTKGTLFEFVNSCCTAFGLDTGCLCRRKLREWILHPLVSLQSIQRRQAAVRFLMSHLSDLEWVQSQLRRLSDLPRALARIHSHSVPRSIIIVLANDGSAQRVRLLEDTLQHLESLRAICSRLVRLIDDASASSGEEPGARLRQLVTPQSKGGLMPPLEEAIDDMSQMFDRKQAQTHGTIKPNQGAMPDYDHTKLRLEALTADITKYRASLQKQLSRPDLKLVSWNRKRFLIEIPCDPEEQLQMPREFDLENSTKKVARFSTRHSRAMAAEIEQAEQMLAESEKDAARYIFSRFSDLREEWQAAIDVAAELDCLLSLAAASQAHPGCCMPVFVPFEGESVLKLRGAVYPCLYEKGVARLTQEERTFVPNDIVLGCEENPERFVMVTGPNMGGKSTLLRTACCLVILAQLGCCVPAASCRLTPVDRIMTRIGAADAIMEGKSTFTVEMEETALILNQATSRSLVILDELGRGTSTHDGTAVAHAVVHHLAHAIRCLTLFSTHYYILVDQYKNDQAVAQYHMESVVEGGDLIFTFRFIRGAGSKSFGISVAHAAGLPDKILQRAKQKSAEFEAQCRSNKQKVLSVARALFPPLTGPSLRLPPSTQLRLTEAVRSRKQDLRALLLLKELFEFSLTQQMAEGEAAQQHKKQKLQQTQAETNKPQSAPNDVDKQQPQA